MGDKMSVGMKLIWIGFVLCWVGLFLFFKWIDLYVSNIPAEILNSPFVNESGELNVFGIIVPTLVPGGILLYVVTTLVMAIKKKITWKQFSLFGGTLVLFLTMAALATFFMAD